MARQERQSSSATLPEPLRNAASVLRKVPGAGMVSRATEGALDKVGAVSPRGRRMAVYAGAGVLGVAGVVEWPVAVTGAAVAWLTQPRPKHPTSGDAVSAEDGAPAVEEAMSTPVGTEPTAGGAVPPPVTEVTAPLGPTPTPPGADSAPMGTAPVTDAPGPVSPHPGAEAAPAAPAPGADVPGPTAPDPGAPGPAESLTGRSDTQEHPDRTTD
ncbi:hypothetical protein [Streptomyces griseorubiginosus]|uniref:hypothetical protein n=1 Tax=Streptomyces griseorubiginosus TaxID=67304 RepID=UPI001FCC22DE|nr:hypothetical protein [Streptomyces griseorubiginosus]